jgi:DNA-binding PadR family transcriptional regulator
VKRTDLILSSLAPGSGATYTPVQIQKLLFLVDEEVADRIGGRHFNFVPYHYGPFDKTIYNDLEDLENDGAVAIERDDDLRIRKFRLTQNGAITGLHCLEKLDPVAKDYIERANKFVRERTFAQLVSAIYRAYPRMKANSIFGG